MLFFIAVLFTGCIITFGVAQSLILPLLPFPERDLIKLAMAPAFLAAATLSGIVSLRYLPATGRIHRQSLLIVMILPVTLQILAIPLYNLSLKLFPPGEMFFALMRTLQPTGHPLDTFGAIFSIVLIGPVCEEFVFRGVMMERALSENRNIHLIVWLQAILFGLAHMNPWQLFYAFAFGAVFGYLRIWAGGISLTVLLHTLVNGISILAGYIDLPFYQETPDGAPVDIDAYLVGLAFLTAVAVIIPLYLSYRSNRRASISPP